MLAGEPSERAEQRPDRERGVEQDVVVGGGRAAAGQREQDAEHDHGQRGRRSAGPARPRAEDRAPRSAAAAPGEDDEPEQRGLVLERVQTATREPEARRTTTAQTIAATRTDSSEFLEVCTALQGA